MKHGIKPFAEQGHYTEAHNLIFDFIMPRVSANAFKVLCLILRRTKGWSKRSDVISYEQIVEGTGIKSHTTISKVIGELLVMGCILCKSGKATCATSAYALNLKYEVSHAEIYTFSSPENEEEKPKETSPENEEATNPPSPFFGEVSSSFSGEVVESEASPENGDTKENKTSTKKVSTSSKSESTLARDKEFQILREQVLQTAGKFLDWQRGTLGSLDERAMSRLLAKLTSDGRTARDVEIYRAALPGYFGRAPDDVTPPSLGQMHSNFDKVLRFAAQSKSGSQPGIGMEELRRRTEEFKNQKNQQGKHESAK